jgi:DNA-binding beta-propeller fold protein YncE
LEADLVARIAIPTHTGAVPQRPDARTRPPNGRAGAWTFAPTLPETRRHGWVRFALAALLLVGLGGWALAAFIDSRGTDDGPFVGIPAPWVTPGATPPVGPVEFLWQSRGTPDDPMARSGLIAVAPDGTIWVPDSESDRIRIFSQDGTLLDVWGSPGTGEGEFDFGFATIFGYGPGAIAFDAAGNVYVADTGNHRIQKFGPDRRFLTAWGTEGRGDGQFMYPSDVAVDAQGRVFVLDSTRYNQSAAPEGTFVQVFDSDGRFLFDWGQGTEEQEPDRLFASWGIGIDPDGTVLLVDGDRNKIQRFTAEGVFLEMWDLSGTDNKEFPHPTDVAVDEQGRIFVTEWGGYRVTVLDRNGRVLASWGESSSDGGQFLYPYGIALDGQGNVYVTDGRYYGADDDGRLQAFRILTFPEPDAAPAS